MGLGFSQKPHTAMDLAPWDPALGALSVPQASGSAECPARGHGASG